MPNTIDEAFANLRRLFDEQFRLQAELDRILTATSAAELERKGRYYLRKIREKQTEIKAYLQDDLLRFPPHHNRHHSEELKRFHEVASYEKSIFVMTKFPDGNEERDVTLKAVIQEVRNAITDVGYTPRIAEYGYHDWLWHNVELYLLGCCKGIAIVEDRYKHELNPNVALEWGWMKGMGKKVFFLMEKGFAHERADWRGLISKTFAWDEPQDGIRAAIAEWIQADSEV